VKNLTNKRFMYLLLIASLLAFAFACLHGIHIPKVDGMSDGGGLGAR
jgi:hypothetical protein